jgi:hypothetical protein
LPGCHINVVTFLLHLTFIFGIFLFKRRLKKALPLWKNREYWAFYMNYGWLALQKQQTCFFLYYEGWKFDQFFLQWQCFVCLFFKLKEYWKKGRKLQRQVVVKASRAIKMYR